MSYHDKGLHARDQQLTAEAPPENERSCPDRQHAAAVGGAEGRGGGVTIYCGMVPSKGVGLSGGFLRVISGATVPTCRDRGTRKSRVTDQRSTTIGWHTPQQRQLIFLLPCRADYS